MNNDIAVSGLAGRFPGAPDIDSFWTMLEEGRSGMIQLDEVSLRASEVPEAEWRRPDYVPVWAGIEGVDQFASSFFGMSPREAEVLDPQQRLLLETTRHALEDAGIEPSSFPGEIGVYAGVGFNRYLTENLLPNTELVDSVGRFVLATSNDKDNVAARLSYKLDLRGPSMTVQTNCSTGLVAIHQAIGALLDYQCDAAVVAVSSVKSRGPQGYRHEPDGTTSPSGVCRAFDAEADGYFIGDGVAAVVLRRSEDVEADHDPAYALIKGSAVNNDGAAKVSYSATSKAAQVKVMSRALLEADVDAASVRYVEANGSATEMGDAIELSSLGQVYGSTETPCFIGSLKPSVGNLDTLSGLGSFIKAVLSLHHGYIPATLNYKTPNPHSQDLGSSLIVANETRAWDEMATPPFRAGVSSFAVGGTNAHLILEKASAKRSSNSSASPQVIAVSARTGDELAELTRSLTEHLCDSKNEQFGNVAKTLLGGRQQFRHRMAVVAHSPQEAVRALHASRPVLAQEGPAWGVVLDDVVEASVVEALRKTCLAFDERYTSILEMLDDHSSAPIALTAFAAHLALLQTMENWGLRPSGITGPGVAAAAVSAVLAEPSRLGEAVSGLVAGRDLTSEAPAGWQEWNPNLTALADSAPTALIHIGSATMLAEHLEIPVFRLLDSGQAKGVVEVLEAVARLWEFGVEVDATTLTTGARTRLPGYPFSRATHWVEPATQGAPSCSSTADTSAGLGSLTPLEEAVALIWRRRLGLSSVSLDDSLLDLGGDSLRATQILANVADAFQVDLSLRDFLERPTIRAMAAAIHRRLVEARELREALDALEASEGIPQ